MKIFHLYFLLLFLAATATAQRKSITDSLERLLAVSKADTNRVLLLKTLAQYSHRAKPDTALLLAKEGALLARHLTFKRGEAECLLTQGVILEQQGHYPQALVVLLESKKLSESLDDPGLFSRILRSQGKLYASQGDYAQAKAYLLEAKSIQETRGRNFLATTLKIIGEFYFEREQLDSALIYLNQAYQMQGNNEDVGLDDILKDLGGVQAALGNDAQAMRYFRSSIPYSIADDDQTTLNEAYLGLAKLSQKTRQVDSSIYYSQRALEAAQKINYSKGILAASRLLSEVYEPVNVHEAFRYYKMASAFKDSVFNAEKAKQVQNLGFMEQQRLQSMEAARLEYKNRVKVYALLSALGVFLLLALILWRNNRYKQRAKVKIEKAYEELKAAQAQLVQREKMASLGELTAGIAHEIQNPLNFVNNFSEVSAEQVDEMEKAALEGHKEEVTSIAIDIRDNLLKVIHHGKRADAIVKGMLQHSRSSTGSKEPTDINALANEYLRLSYHGFLAKDKDFNTNLIINFDESIRKVEVVPQELGSVLLNIYNNAFYAVNEKKKQLNGTFEPAVVVSTKRVGEKVEISVRDNGFGIPENVLDKIFQPFFTTKPTGEGIGLGLSLSYDTIKALDGELKVNTKEGMYAEFVVQLPI